VLALLAAATVVTLLPGLLFRRTGVLVVALVLGLASQGIKIVVDTLVQTNVDDAFRGRVFALYDVIFNVAFVAAAAVGAVVLPDDGRSPGVLVAVAAGYLLVAGGYARATRPR
jgi:predicted MFS family arabinose efflux permease